MTEPTIVAELARLRAENAGLREALEASEEEWAKERDYLQRLLTADTPRRKAARTVVEAAAEVARGYRLLAAAGFSLRRESTALVAAVDSYAQSSNPGEKS